MRRHLLVVAASTVIALAVVEAGLLRGVLGYRGIADLAILQRDLEIGWTLMPNARSWHAALDFGVWVNTDDLGFRTTETGARHTSGRADREVLVLGDSFAFGWGVTGEQMVSSALARELSTRSASYAVRTAGVPGYSTDQEYLLWRRLSPVMHPDQVVLLFHQSDPPANIQLIADMSRFAYHKPRFQVVDGRLHLAGVPVPDKDVVNPLTALEPVKALLRPLALYGLLQASLRNGFTWSVVAPAPAVRPIEPAAYAMTAELLKALDGDIRAHGATLLVALIPTAPDMTQRLAGMCRTLGIAFLDLQAAFTNQSGVRLVHDGHWNARGHAVAARAIAPLVR